MLSRPLADRPSYLLARLGNDSGLRFSELLAGEGLAPPHVGLLSLIAQEEGQTQQQLAETLGVHRNVMVGLVDTLEGRGWVERRRHPEDRRAYAVLLTRQGRAAHRRLGTIVDAHDAALLEPLAPQDREQFVAALRTVAAGLGLRPWPTG